jgi:hypothetical protein
MLKSQCCCPHFLSLLLQWLTNIMCVSRKRTTSLGHARTIVCEAMSSPHPIPATTLRSSYHSHLDIPRHHQHHGINGVNMSDDVNEKSGFMIRPLKPQISRSTMCQSMKSNFGKTQNSSMVRLRTTVCKWNEHFGGRRPLGHPLLVDCSQEDSHAANRLLDQSPRKPLPIA